MSINNFSNNPFYLVDPVTYASVGYKIYVYTGAVVDAQIIGSGDDPSLKFIAAQVNTSLAGDRSLTLTNVSVKNSVYGGIVVSTSSDPAKPKISKKFIPGLDVVLDGDTNLSVTNGKIKEIYGGGGGFGSTVTGDATIDFNGGIVNSIYGGGSHRSVVEGDVLININGGSSSDSKISKIYGGGNDSTVVGNTTIVFNPDASLLDFRGAVYGGGKGSGAIVGGTRTLVFNDYSGDFNASIKDFTNIKLSGSANVTINKPLDKSLAGATFEFYLTDETLKNVTSMLTLNKKHDNINNVTITIDSAEIIANGGEIYLITSKYFRYESSFNADNVLVLNSSGQKISQFTYTINYIFDKKDGGYVSIDYQGSSLVIDGTQTERVILSDADEEVNIIAGGHLAAGLNASGGNDTVNVQAGAEVNGGLLMGDGDDVLYIQKGSNVNGYIDMQGGNDRVVVNEEALLTSDVAMGSGTNVIDINKLAMLTGRIILTDGSVNTINVNGGAFSGIDSGDGTTFNTIVVDGTSDHAGVIGSWYDYYMPADEYHPGYYVTVFDRQDLILGDSIDDVTFCSYAEVGNIILGGGNDSLLLKDQSYVEGSIYLGGGDDYLTINSGATIDGDIYLGAGDDIVILNQVFNGQFYADEGANVIVAKANMQLNAEALNLGSTQSVLVVANGYTVELTGMSLGNFLEIQNDATYLDQNASIVSHGQQFIQNYTGHLTVDGDEPNDLYIMAAPENTPSQVAPFLNMITDGVIESEIMAGGNLILETGANVDQSELTVAGHSQIDGNLTDSELSGSTAALDGTVENSIVEMTGLVDINGTVSESTVDSDGVVNINGTVTDSSVSSATTLNINGVVSGSDLSGADIFINVDTFSGTLTGGTANFSADFYNSSLVVDTGLINLTTAGIVVTIASSDAAAGVFADDVQLIEVAEDQITVGTITGAIDFGTLGWTNVVLLEQVDVDMAFNGNTVTFAESMDASLFNGTATLSGDNSFVISGSAWLDWQQLVFNPGATVDFDLADYALFSVDGLVDVDPMDIVADTAFGQNSLLALGEWLYIQDWNNNFVLTDHQNPFDQGSATNLTWDNLYIVDNAEIWGGVILGETSDDELVVGDGVVINGATALYDYAAIQALGGMDIITVGASTINGTIDAGDGNDQLFLNNSNVNVAINQGVPAIDMGADDDEAVITNSTVNGDIDMGAGADTLTIDPSTVTGDIDLGADDDVATIDASTVNGNLFAGNGADEVSIISGSTFIGDIAMEAGNDILNITDSTVTGDISTGDDDDTIDILGSTITGDIDTGDGNDTVTITDSNTTINGNILLGDGDDEITMTNSVVNGDVSLGDGTNTADILDSTISGDLLGGYNSDYVSLDNTVISGSLALGYGGANEITAGDVAVSQDVTLGVREDEYGEILYSQIANNYVDAEGAFTIGNDLIMSGDDNYIDVTGSLDVGGSVDMNAYNPKTNVVTIFSGGGMTVGGDFDMDAPGTNRIEFDTNVDSPSGASSLIVTGELNMTGEDNEILPASSNSLTEDEELIVGDITNSLQASALNMNGDTNFLGFSVSGMVDGSYFTYLGPEPDLHVISRLELGNSTLTFDAPVTMYAASINTVELGMFLDADQEGDIYVTGDSVITATGGFDMTGASNEFFGGLFLNAGEQSHIVVEGDASFTVDGSVVMDATDDNYAELGLSITEFEAPDILTSDGEVDVLGTYAVNITGDFIMVGSGALNDLILFEGVTIGGDIIMGEVAGDTVSAANYLEVVSVGSLNTTDVTMIAEDNDLILGGSGTITSSLSLFGGDNYLFIGEDVDVQSIVAIGGVYDADQIGTEGYQIVENTTNTIIVYGSIMGIDTTMDLGTPLDFVSTADDDIQILPGGTVSPNGIITGNGDDTVLIEGGFVEGGVSMGDTTFGDAVGTNMLTLASVNVDDDPLLSLEANIVGDVSMESDTENTLNIDGAVLVDETMEETEVRATIDGDVFMAALQHDEDGNLKQVGTTNTLNIGIAASITGGVTMYSTVAATNSVIVDADWLKEYYTDYGLPTQTLDHTFDGTSDVLSLEMHSDANVLTVNTGTFIINELAGNVGISMTQDQPDRYWTGGTNAITVSDEAALVMESDIVMGNFTSDLAAIYEYTEAVMAGDYEVYVYDWTNQLPIIDTTLNEITVGGKLYTANNVMTGDTNRIDVTGPASTSVNVSSGEYDLTTALYDGDAVTQQGKYNEILVGVNGTPGPGEAVFNITGDVNQWGAASDIASITNLIEVDSAALFNSANINQLASDSNDIIVSGVTVPMDPLGDPATYQDEITNSVINGQISQIATEGYNNIELVNSDVNGDISQETLSPDGLYNTLSATGTALPFYVLSTPGSDDTLAAENIANKSTITGTITQVAVGYNEINLNIADVTGSISQSTETQDNSLISSGAYLYNNGDLLMPGGPAVYGQDVDGNDIWLQDAYVDENLIDGPLTQVAANGSNTAELTLTNVNGAVSQTASTGNTLSATGQYIDSTVGSNMDSTVSLLQAQDVYWAGVNGGVTMITDTGINGLDFSLADINGALDMTASAGANDAAIEGNVFSDITMNAAQNNDLDVLGTYYPAVTGVDNLNNDLEIIDPAYVSEALVDGSISMNSATGNNTAYLDTADVTDSISMTALLGDNDLDVVGRIIPAVEVPVHVPPYNNEGAELAPGQRLDATIGGGITMDATNALDTDGGSNDAYLETAIVALDVNMNAYDSNTIKVTDSTIVGSIITNAITGSNTVNIDPSTVGGNVDMNAGESNTLIVSGEPNPAVAVEDPDTGDDILEPVTGNDPDPSTIVGNVTMDATTGSNSATFDLATVGGAVSMNAETGNTLDVDGHYYQAVIGSNADDTSSYSLLAKEIFFTQLGTDITDDVTMNTNSGDNVANILYGQLAGGLDMDSTLGGNTAGIVGSIGTDLEMLGAMDNVLTLTGIYISDVQDFGVESGNDYTVLDDPYDQISSIGGSLTMNSSGGGNTATITYGSTGSITMGAPEGSNILTVAGQVIPEVTVPGAIPPYDNDGDVLIPEQTLLSIVDGDVSMTAVDALITTGGSNTATFENATVNGGINMLAYDNNTLTITDTTVNGGIDMMNWYGDNTLTINPVSSISGTISMDAGFNNILTVNGYIEPAVVEVDSVSGDEILISPPEAQMVIISDLEMLSAFGSNTANLYLVQVDNNILMDSWTSNTLNMNGEYVPPTVGDNADDSQSVLYQQFVAESTVAGNVTMDAWDDNTATLSFTSITGNMDMTSDLGSNDLILGEFNADPELVKSATIQGALTMTAYDGNSLTAYGFWHYPAFGPDSSDPQNEIVLPGSPGSVVNAMLYAPSEIGSVAMTTDTLDNNVTLEYTFVHGLLSMDAVLGDNFLTVDGITIDAYDSHYGPNTGTELVPAETILSELEGGVLMNAANGAVPTDGGSNTAVIGLTNVTGSVDMFAYIDNNLTVTGNFEAHNLVVVNPGTGEEGLDPATTVTPSTVGDIDMEAVTGDNTATLTWTDSGAITMNAWMYNTLTVTGAEIPEVEGDDGAGGTQVLQAASIDYNVVAGGITVNSLWDEEYNFYGIMNTVSLNMAQVLGDISIDSQWGTDDPGHVADQTENKNSVTIADSIIGDDTVPVYYDVTVTANSGTNLVDISDSVLGNLTASSTNGYNDVTVDPSTVYGNVDMDADLDNTLELHGDYTGAITGDDGSGNEILVSATDVVDTVVTGDVTIDSVSAYNSMGMYLTAVNGSVSMDAMLGNSLDMDGEYFISVICTNADGSQTLPEAQFIAESTIDVDLVMDAAMSDNLVDMLYASVGGDATMNADAASNMLTITGSIYGALDMNAEVDNTIVANGEWYYPATGADSSVPQNEIVLDGDTLLVYAVQFGDVAMDAVTGDNSFTLNIGDVTNNIGMTALAGGNTLDIDGVVTLALDSSLPGNLGDEVVPASTETADIGGSITMTAADSRVTPTTGASNLANIDIATVGGDVDMFAYDDNELYVTDSDITGSVITYAETGANTVEIDPSTVGGNIDMDADLDNTLSVLGLDIPEEYGPSDPVTGEQFLDSLAQVDESVVTGAINMDSVSEDNDATIQYADTGAITMNALLTNTLDVEGWEVADIWGNDGAGDPLGKLLQAAEIETADISGDVGMTSTYQGIVAQGLTGIINDASFTLATVENISMTSAWGTDDPTTADQTQVINDLDILNNSVAGDVTMYTNSGRNRINIQNSSVDNLYLESVNGENIVDFEAIILNGSVHGDISEISADSNTFNISGQVIVDPDTLVETEVRATVDGSLTMQALDYDDVSGDLLPGTTNTLAIGVAAVSILGDVTMQASDSNTVTVDADWIKEYVGGPADGHVFDGTSDVLSLTMISDANSLSIDEGTFYINPDDTAGTIGLSMTQEQTGRTTAPSGTNTVFIDQDAVMIQNSDILMGNIVDLVVFQGTYTYFATTTLPDGTEVYWYNWNGISLGDFFDTTTNTITVDGKMFTGDNVMYAETNTIEVTGPADTNVDTTLTIPLPGGGTVDIDFYTETAALYQGGLVTQAGLDNQILVGVNPLSALEPGEALFVSSDIVQSGYDDGSILIAADTNTINVADDAGFTSGSITQIADNDNNINISGYLVPAEPNPPPVLPPLTQDDPTYQDSVVESTVDGAVSQLSTDGDNLATMITTDINGGITQEDADLSSDNINSLTVYGKIIEAVEDTPDTTYNIYGFLPAVDYVSLIDGDISQVSSDNTAVLGINVDVDNRGKVNVTGSVSMTGATDNDLSFVGDIGGSVTMSGSGANTLATDGITYSTIINNDNPFNVILLRGESVDESYIEGPVSLNTSGGGNAAVLRITDVNGDITLSAGGQFLGGGDNSFESYGYHVDTISGLIGGNLTLLQAQYMVVNDINGDISMTTRSNNLIGTVGIAGMSFTDVTGALSMTTSTAGMTNTAHILGSQILDGVTMTAVDDDNTFISEGTWFDANIVDVELIEKSFIGGLTQTTAGSNSATLNVTDVTGNIAQDSTTSNNTLNIWGDTIPATIEEGGVRDAEDLRSAIDGRIDMDTIDYDGFGVAFDGASNTADIYMADITNAIDLLAFVDNTLDITDSNLDGTIDMYAETGSNWLTIDPSTVDNTITMEAGTDNSLTAAGGNFVDHGTITQPGGGTNEQFLNDPATVDSTVLAAVDMISNGGSNTASLTDTDTGAFSMDAAVGNNLTIFSHIPEILGYDDNDNPRGKVLQAADYCTITGNLDMTSETGNNILNMTVGEVTGTLTVTGDSYNELNITNSLITGGINIVDTGTITNNITISGSTITGGITTPVTVNPLVTEDVAEVISISDYSTVTGGIVTGDNDDTFTVGIANPDTSSVDSITAGDGDDYLEIGVNGMVSSINMGLGDDTVYINRDDYNISLIDTTTEGNESITIVGTSTDFTVQGASFGAIDVNTVVEDADFDTDSTITFNYAGGAGTTIAGNIDTVSGAHSVTTILDATGLAKGGADLIAVANDDPTFTSWDLLNVCGQGELELVMGNYDTNANDVFDLVSGYEGPMNLYNWTANSITLTHTNTSGDTETINLTWNFAGAYTGSDWTLGVNLSGTDDTLQLAYQLAP